MNEETKAKLSLCFYFQRSESSSFLTGDASLALLPPRPPPPPPPPPCLSLEGEREGSRLSRPPLHLRPQSSISSPSNQDQLFLFFVYFFWVGKEGRKGESVFFVSKKEKRRRKGRRRRRCCCCCCFFPFGVEPAGGATGRWRRK